MDDPDDVPVAAPAPATPAAAPVPVSATPAPAQPTPFPKPSEIVATPEWQAKSPTEKAEGVASLFQGYLTQQPDVAARFNSADDKGKAAITGQFKTQLAAKVPGSLAVPGFTVSNPATGGTVQTPSQNTIGSRAEEKILALIAPVPGHFSDTPEDEAKLATATAPARQAINALTPDQKDYVSKLAIQRYGPNYNQTGLLRSPQDVFGTQAPTLKQQVTGQAGGLAARMGVVALGALAGEAIDPLGGGIPGAIIGGASGSVAGQEIEKSQGLRDKISTGDLALDTLTAMIPGSAIERLGIKSVGGRIAAQAAEHAALGAGYTAASEALNGQGKVNAADIGSGALWGLIIGSGIHYTPRALGLIAGKSAPDALATLKAAAAKDPTLNKQIDQLQQALNDHIGQKMRLVPTGIKSASESAQVLAPSDVNWQHQGTRSALESATAMQEANPDLAPVPTPAEKSAQAIESGLSEKERANQSPQAATALKTRLGLEEAESKPALGTMPEGTPPTSPPTEPPGPAEISAGIIQQRLATRERQQAISETEDERTRQSPQGLASLNAQLAAEHGLTPEQGRQALSKPEPQVPQSLASQLPQEETPSPVKRSLAAQKADAEAQSAPDPTHEPGPFAKRILAGEDPVEEENEARRNAPLDPDAIGGENNPIVKTDEDTEVPTAKADPKSKKSLAAQVAEKEQAAPPGEQRPSPDVPQQSGEVLPEENPENPSLANQSPTNENEDERLNALVGENQGRYEKLTPAQKKAFNQEVGKPSKATGQQVFGSVHPDEVSTALDNVESAGKKRGLTGNRGAISGQLAAHLGGAVTGGLAGYASGDDEESKLERAAVGALAGLVAAHVLSSRAAQNFYRDPKGTLTDIRKSYANNKEAIGLDATLSREMDAAGNLSDNFATGKSNEVRRDIIKTFPKVKDQKLATVANGQVIESQRSKEALAKMRAKVDSIQPGTKQWSKITPEMKAEYLAGNDFADKNWDALQPIADKQEAIQEDERLEETDPAKGNMVVLKRPGYLLHDQDITMDNPRAGNPTKGGSGNPTGFSKNRTHDTYADSMFNNVPYKTIDSTDLLQQRLSSGQRLMNRKAWFDGLSGYKDPFSHEPVAAPLVEQKRADGSTYMVPPSPDYTTMQTPQGPVAVHKNFASMVDALNSPSWFRKGGVRSAVLDANGVAKSIMLGVDTFHGGRVAATEAGAAVANKARPLSGSLRAVASEGDAAFGKKAVNTADMGRSLTILNNSPETLAAIAKDRGFSPQETAQILSEKEDSRNLIKQGLNVGRAADAMNQSWLAKIPLVGGKVNAVNEGIFEKLQPSAMHTVANLELNRIRRLNPERPPNDPRNFQEAAKQTNTVFGSLGRQGWLKSATAQDFARLLFLAPQWNEGLIKREVGTVTGAGKSLVGLAQGKGLHPNLNARTVGVILAGYFIANQAVNMMSRGQPTWKNREEGIDSKISAYVPDVIGKGPGFMMSPLSLGAELTHLGIQSEGRTGDLGKTLVQMLGSRESAVSRPLATFLANRDQGGTGNPLAPGLASRLKATASAATPLPIAAPAIYGAIKSAVTGQNQESQPGQFQRQIMSTVGLKPDSAPSPGEQISRLAREYRQANGTWTQGESTPSAYEPMHEALRAGNQKQAVKEIDNLVASGHTPTAIAEWLKTMPNHTLTGSHDQDEKFIATLTDDQKQLGAKADEENQKVSDAGHAALLQSESSGRATSRLMDGGTPKEQREAQELYDEASQAPGFDDTPFARGGIAEAMKNQAALQPASR